MPIQPCIDSHNIFGAEIQYYRVDPRYWEAILDHFVESGLQCVTTFVQWCTHIVGEPDVDHPAGVLDFEGRTDPRLNLKRFLELVTQRGLQLNFRCGPFCCNETATGGYPDWLVMGDPNIMVWDHQNRPQQGYWIARRQGMQPSYLHPTYLQWVEKWFAAVAPIIKANLKSAGGCITMLSLDNEVSYIVQDSFLGSDYNPVNVNPGGFYHQFLREKYGNNPLPYHNQSGDLTSVVPPRSVPEKIGDNIAWYLDWIEFKTWVMKRYIATLRQMHQANGITDDIGITFMSNFNPHRPEGVPTRMCEFEEAVGPQGIVGYDFYRGGFMSYSGYHSMARVLKLMNVSVRYTWAAEFMAGLWNKDMSGYSRISDDHMRFMARCALAQGCKSIAWFMFHDRDTWGDAPVSSHGHARPSLEVLRETPELLFEKIDNWDRLRPCTDVTIVYDLTSHQHTSIGDPSPCSDNTLHIGKPCIAGVNSGQASAEYEGLFRLVEQAGYQAGAIDPLCVQQGEILATQKLVILPGSPIIHQMTAACLKDYVMQGGTLIVTGCWPTLDQNGRPLRFLDCDLPSNTLLGSGQIIWHDAYMGQAQPEEDTLENIEQMRLWIEQNINTNFAVRTFIKHPVEWIAWSKPRGTCSVEKLSFRING